MPWKEGATREAVLSPACGTRAAHVAASVIIVAVAELEAPKWCLGAHFQRTPLWAYSIHMTSTVP